MASTIKFLAIAAVFGVSACAGDGIIGKRDRGQKLVNACLVETGVPGAYSSQAGQKVPVVTPVTTLGGTREGAASLNECIRQKAAASGQTTTTQTTGTTTTTTYTYGTPPAKKRARRAKATQSSSFCPKHAGTIYGGSMYCIGNQ